MKRVVSVPDIIGCLWVPKIGAFDSIVYFWMMVDPWIHGTADPVHADVGGYIYPISAVFAGGGSVKLLGNDQADTRFEYLFMCCRRTSPVATS